MPASTLPTRSAPTSAPLVKMPPPRRAKIEISDEPNARPDQRVQRRVLGVARVMRQHDEVAGDAEQRKADHQHAGDRAAAERDGERGCDAAPRGFGRAHVRAHGDVHADVAGEAREDRADRKTDRGAPVQRETDHDEQHDADDRDRRVLAIEIRARAFLDRRGDLLHALVAGRFGQDPADRPDAVENRQDRADQRDQQTVLLEQHRTLP